MGFECKLVGLQKSMPSLLYFKISEIQLPSIFFT